MIIAMIKMTVTDKEILATEEGKLLGKMEFALSGYLYCLGDISDIPLIKKAKYGINMDVGCMIDSEWLTSLENGGIEDSFTRSRVDLIRDFIDYYSNYSADDDF